jgi:hypothetical protein
VGLSWAYSFIGFAQAEPPTDELPAGEGLSATAAETPASVESRSEPRGRPHECFSSIALAPENAVHTPALATNAEAWQTR